MLAAHVEFNDALTYFKQPPGVVYQQNVEGGPLPIFGDAGTGGVKWLFFAAERHGYKDVVLLKSPASSVKKVTPTPFASLMETIQIGFGRTFSHLPTVFGVSRQTLYNWLSGETPNPKHQSKLLQLANVAETFIKEGFTPTSSSLSRTVMNGKSLLELLRDGANGEEMAAKLIRISRRGDEAKMRIKTLLEGREVATNNSIVGLRAFSDEV